MHVQTIEGVVHNGQIELRDEVKLPENTKVYVVVPEQSAGFSARMMSPRLANPALAKELKLEILENGSDAKI